MSKDCIRFYKGNSKGLFFIKFFRIAHLTCKNKWTHILGCPIWLLYRFVFNWIMGVDIHESTKIGRNFIIWHGFGVVVHPQSIIGDNVTIHQNVTIGNAKNGGMPPILGNRVYVGAGSIIVGDIKIGDNVIIGAGSVVVKDVPNDSVVVGNPAKKIKTNE